MHGAEIALIFLSAIGAGLGKLERYTMQDRSWMLNPPAITAAKRCIQLIQDELNIKLKLSHPNFIEMINEYCDLTDSEPMAKAFAELLDFAGSDIAAKKLPPTLTQKIVTPITEQKTSGELIQFNGKSYLRFDADGREFKGLYRGGSRYG